jgi:hypothetical protein
LGNKKKSFASLRAPRNDVRMEFSGVARCHARNVAVRYRR